MKEKFNIEPILHKRDEAWRIKSEEYKTLLNTYGFISAGRNEEKGKEGDLYVKNIDGQTITLLVTDHDDMGARYVQKKVGKKFEPLISGWGAPDTQELEDGWLKKFFKKEQ